MDNNNKKYIIDLFFDTLIKSIVPNIAAGDKIRHDNCALKENIIEKITKVSIKKYNFSKFFGGV
ncbi:hypothetical protein CBG25_13660 [Arsenophonus sp. ENCA]|uniref:hypothetical protein n=1 Tax=Arsenophonus sp. ENCA TaxID=1987579 RepID=UPI000BD318D8|nr:hypothetical protein [Arsenophonus sp. ENCA]PAV01975.1 hypothetical protein CBG25_13660 [Arsenophonus sp. ENCA]